MKRNVITLSIVSCLVIVALSSVLLAGAVGGPKYGDRRVEAYGTNVFNVWFEGNEPAVILVSGDGDTDLDLYVFDKYGRCVASDTDCTDQCVVHFWPKRIDEYTIEVRNLGEVYNEYRIVTN